MAPFDERRGPSELRAGDVAMALLDYFENGGYPFASDGIERAQVLAFIVGYFSHGVGDTLWRLAIARARPMGQPVTRLPQIGRASCRERVYNSLVYGALKIKKERE